MQADATKTTISASDAVYITSPENATTRRGRTRDRSHVRSDLNGKITERIDNVEASTFRGRSRQRASSPYREPTGSPRNPSGSLLSPTRQILLYNRLYYPNREHCPSRAHSSTAQRRRRRTRSRSRGPSGTDNEGYKIADSRSGLRHEVLMDPQDAPLGGASA